MYESEGKPEHTTYMYNSYIKALGSRPEYATKAIEVFR
jgi:hypothetical protein